MTINRGQIVGLLGPNGAEATGFYVIVGLIKADRGSIFLDKSEISNQPIYAKES